MIILEARQITKFFQVGTRSIPVLDAISLTVAEGESLVVKGSSGSGKSTLLSILSGLDRPSSGRIIIDGRDITQLSENQLAPLRNRFIGFVFQAFHLVPALTALENVMFPAELRRDQQAQRRAVELLQRVGLGERQNNFPHQLSGGEKQRVAICRAMINHPRLLFADEPTGNLDSRNSRAVLKLLLDLKREQGATLILVTHNQEIARSADRIITLADGRIQSEKPMSHYHAA